METPAAVLEQIAPKTPVPEPAPVKKHSVSEETKQKISATQKKLWEAKRAAATGTKDEPEPVPSEPTHEEHPVAPPPVVPPVRSKTKKTVDFSPLLPMFEKEKEAVREEYERKIAVFKEEYEKNIALIDAGIAKLTA